MPQIYNVQMTRREFELVPKMIGILVGRLHLDNPAITYKELAGRLGTHYRKLGQPLLKMAQVISQCPISPKAPSLNALVVYSGSHLPSVNINNAGLSVGADRNELRRVMKKANKAAKDYTHWDDVIKDICRNIRISGQEGEYSVVLREYTINGNNFGLLQYLLNKQDVQSVSVTLPGQLEQNIDAVGTYRLVAERATTIRSPFISHWLTENNYQEGKLFSAKLQIVTRNHHRYYDIVPL